MKRVVLFLLTNLAILVVLSVAFGVLSASGALEGFDSAYVPLAVMATLFGFGGSMLSLLLSKWVARRATGAEVIATPRTEVEAWLVRTVDRQARAVGITTPEVAIYESPEPNAFATGATRNSALVAVSTGLLQRLRREEVEAVLAHEVSHAANGDMVTLALMQGVVNTFVIFFSRVIGNLVDTALSRGEERRGPGIGYGVSVVVAELALGLLATLLVMAFSRWREYRADAGAARLAGAPRMIAALGRLGSEGTDLPQSMAAFGIRGGRSGLLRLFSSHPPIEDRIRRLQAAGR
ncbi:MAG: protease HtpX [Polyangiaceae bacterium]|nr:protease HtpX [Polyangiaceae bacterium]